MGAGPMSQLPPPPGFVLEEPPQAGGLPPPPGFVLEEAAPTPTPQAQGAPAATAAPPRGMLGSITDFLFPGGAEGIGGQFHAMAEANKPLVEAAKARQPLPMEGVGQRAAHSPLMMSISPSNIGGALTPKPLSRGQQLLDKFNKLNVTPRLAAVSQGKTAALAQKTVEMTPGVGDLASSRAKTTVRETGEAADRIAKGYGQAKSTRAAGHGLRAGVQNWATDTFPKRGNELYEKYWSTSRTAKPWP
jgi:hypothetical protein